MYTFSLMPLDNQGGEWKWFYDSLEYQSWVNIFLFFLSFHTQFPLWLCPEIFNWFLSLGGQGKNQRMFQIKITWLHLENKSSKFLLFSFRIFCSQGWYEENPKVLPGFCPQLLCSWNLKCPILKDPNTEQMLWHEDPIINASDFQVCFQMGDEQVSVLYFFFPVEGIRLISNGVCPFWAIA